MFELRQVLIGLVICVGFYLSVALVMWYDVIDHAPSNMFTSDTRLASPEHIYKRRNNRQLLEDKWQTAFIPYLRGVYKNDFECHNTNNERYVHNYTYPPNFSCNSTIPELTEAERSKKVGDVE